MESVLEQVVCKFCQQPGTGRYCSQCSQVLNVRRITFSNLLHEVFHFFTHLDKGFPYTMRMLMTSPGSMQRLYIQGSRVKHQKPFSTFFICATILALILYWLNVVLANYFDAGDAKEAVFFNKYMVMLLIGSIPLMTLITWLFFYNASYNFAEIAVLELYTVSVFFLMVAVLNLLKFIWTDLETRYFELPSILIYNTITFVHFFHTQKKWIVIIKSLVCATIFYITIAMVQDAIVDNLIH
jgi:hypothetical protein